MEQFRSVARQGIGDAFKQIREICKRVENGSDSDAVQVFEGTIVSTCSVL